MRSRCPREKRSGNLLTELVRRNFSEGGELEKRLNRSGSGRVRLTCRSGGIGRHAGLKIQCGLFRVRVRVPPPVPLRELVELAGLVTLVRNSP